MINLADELSVLALKSLGKLPLSVVHTLGAWAGSAFALLPTDTKRVTEINIGLCFPEKSEQFRKALVHSSLRETVITAFEMGPMWAGNCQDILHRVLSVHGVDLIKDAYEQGRGIILLAPHLGNWEVIGYYLSTHYDFTVMYQPGDLPKLSEMILRARKQLNATLVPTDKSGVMALLRGLKKNKLIGILPDQKPDRSSGVLAPFFGVTALTQTLGPKLATQVDAAVVGGVCFRDRRAGGYHVHFLPVDPDVKSDDLSVACAAMNRSIEQWIRMHPEQYQWEYKRFGKRPRDLPDVYNKQSHQ